MLVGIGSQKARAMLYYLATTGQTHSRLALAGLLWGSLPEVNARRNLRKTLTRLRKFANDCLLITRQTVALHPDVDCQIDVKQFRQMSAPQMGVDDWQSAVALYQGDFLDGFYVQDAPEFEAWMLAQRARLHDRAVTCLQQVAGYLAGTRDSTKAIFYAKRLLELEPWREETHRLLMTLYAHSGQIAAAISQYETCYKILADELGVKPSKETEELFANIGQRRFTTRASRTAVSSDLPLPATALVGREAELDELMAHLQDPAVRLLTIVGMGGVGKTRLALALASRLADDAFPDGRYFSSFEALQFSSTQDEEMVQATITMSMLSSMRVTIGPREDPLQQLVRQLRQRRSLLILDNFEPLLLPDVAPMAVGMVQKILAQSAQVKILVTSRQPLLLRAEWIYDIDGLPVPNGDEGETDKTASVRLFNGTARRLNRHFDVDAERVSVHKICALLNGLPLGIELAAGLIRERRVSEIAAQIERTLESVTGKWLDLPPRQRSLKATFEYTWQLLSKPEQQLLSMLSYMRRGFTGDAAQSIAGDLSQFLDDLAVKSLVKMQDERFYLHEVVLEFARQKLDDTPEWSRLVAEQHAHYFLDQIERIEAGLETGDDYPISQVLRPDIENIRAAWQWAVRNGESGHLNRAARGLLVFFQSMGWLSEGMMLLEEAVQALQTHHGQPSVALINCLLQQGLLASLSTDLARAAELAALSAGYLEAAAAQGNSAEISYLQAQHHFLQGYVAHGNADWVKARNYLTEAAATFRRLNRPYDEARATFVIGNGWMGERQWQKVIDTGESVIALCRKTGNLRLEAKALATMAVAYSSDIKLEKARVCRKQAQELSAQISWPVRDEVVWLGMAADQALDAGYLDEAASHIKRTRPLVIQSGSMFYEDWNHIQHGHLFLQLGEYKKALHYYDRARICATLAEKAPMIALALICLCLPDYRRGRSEPLTQMAQALSDIAFKLDGDYHGARAASWTGLALLANGRAAEAKSGFLQALAKTTDETCLCEARWGLMNAYRQIGNQAAARDTAEALMASPLFDNLPMMVTELLLPFQIYHDCWQALLPVSLRQAEEVLQLAARHVRERLHRIENREWKDAYLQEATLQGRFPIHPA